MDTEVKAEFQDLWHQYFNGTELPITFYYTEDETRAPLVREGSSSRCLLGNLAKVRKGESLSLNVDAIGCPGGKRYLGFTDVILPGFEYFLSCGKPGVMEGERYKQSPELVKQFTGQLPTLTAPAKLIVFKRWDMLEAPDDPEVAIFFARPDVLSALFTLANFDTPGNAVMAHFGSGCMSIALYPYLERDADSPHSFLGMFDISARPCVPEDRLTFATPMKKLLKMTQHMRESFLITDSWKRVQKRVSRQALGDGGPSQDS
jgi:uncharacterized protein (DUF169 family)